MFRWIKKKKKDPVRIHVSDIFLQDRLKNLINFDWITQNKESLYQIFPETETHVSNAMIQIGFRLKLLDVDWRNEEELIHIIHLLSLYGFVVVFPNHFSLKRASSMPTLPAKDVTSKAFLIA